MKYCIALSLVFAQRLTVQLALRFDKLRDGGEEGHALAGGLSKGIETFKRGQGVARLASGQVGGLRAAGHFTDPAFSFRLGFAVSSKRAKAALARHVIGKPIARKLGALALGRRLDFAMLDDLREFHFPLWRFSPFLCQIRVCGFDFLNLLRKVGVTDGI